MPCSTYKLPIYGSLYVVRPVGIEPTTIGLKGHCSTTELQAPDFLDSDRLDSRWSINEGIENLTISEKCAKIIQDLSK